MSRRWRVHVGAGELEVRAVGPEDAPAVVLAHGVGSSARFVTAAFGGPFLARGVQLVAYDLRGHGASSVARRPDQHATDAHVADLRAVVASLARPPAVVGGVSLGGHAAVRAVATGVVTVGAVLACLPAWSGRAAVGAGPHAAIADEVRRLGVPAVLDRLRSDTSMPRWLRDTVVTDHARHDPDSLAAALEALDGGDAPDDDEVGTLTVPLALVAWPDDPGHPIEVARRWAVAGRRTALRTTTLAALETGVDRLGTVALDALDAVAPGWSTFAGGEQRLGDA
jgi:pimeloyl-ACP methyl ester carboxylesterase